MTTNIQIKKKNTNLKTKLDYNASLNEPWSEVRLTNLNVREQHIRKERERESGNHVVLAITVHREVSALYAH